jgi:WD40 repeat protein
VGAADESGRRCVVASGKDKAVRVWDLETFECVHELRAHHRRVVCLSDVFALDDGVQKVVSGSMDGTLRVWDICNGVCVSVLEGHTGAVTAVSSVFVDSVGRLCVASGGKDSTVRVWTLADGGLSCTMVERGKAVTAVCAVYVDGKVTIVSGSLDNKVRLWDVDTCVCVRGLRGHTRAVTYVGSAVDGAGRTVIISASEDGTLRTWSHTGEALRSLSSAVHNSGVSCARAIVVDGRCMLTTGTADGALGVWGIDAGACLGVVPVAGGSVHAVSDCFTDGDRALVVTTGEDGVFRVFDVRAIMRSQPFTRSRHTDAVLCVSDSFVGIGGEQLIASGSSDGTVRLWSCDTARLVVTLTGHPARVHCVTSGFIVDGALLVASGCDDNKVRVFDCGSGACVRELVGHSSRVWGVSATVAADAVAAGAGGGVSAAGVVYLASASADTTIRLWNALTGDCVHVLSGHEEAVTCLSSFFTLPSTSALVFASGGKDRTVRLWDVASGACLRCLPCHGALRSVSFGVVDRRGRLCIAGGCSNRVVQLWDADTGDAVATLKAHNGVVSCITRGFVGAGSRHLVASAGRDHTVRVFDVAAGTSVIVRLDERMGLSCGLEPVAISVVNTPDGSQLAVAAGHCVVFLCPA